MPFLVIVAIVCVWILTRPASTAAPAPIVQPMPNLSSQPMAVIASNQVAAAPAQGYFAETGGSDEFTLKTPQPVAVVSTLSNFNGGLGGGRFGGSGGSGSGGLGSHGHGLVPL